MIDLRSDTVTVPTEAMLAAMMGAEVGDDVYGEDPTVNRLERTVADLLGKPAALFVPSGTMANLVSIKTHTQPGDEIILDAHSHPYHYEGGGYAAVAGVSVRFVHTERGIIEAEQIPPLVRPDNVHFPRSRLVTLENTHNRGGGSVYPVEIVAAIAEACRAHDLSLHMDGARLFNACAAAGVEPADYTRHVDSVTVCLSKGLGCPVGSLIAGCTDFVARARRFRKMLGGGMRQAGYLAAAGLYALENHVERLAEDHANARRLADGIREIQGVRLKYDPPETNMVYFSVAPAGRAGAGAEERAAELLETLRGKGVLLGHVGEEGFRAVTHIGISAEDIDRAVEAVRAACA